MPSHLLKIFFYFTLYCIIQILMVVWLLDHLFLFMVCNVLELLHLASLWWWDLYKYRYNNNWEVFLFFFHTGILHFSRVIGIWRRYVVPRNIFISVFLISESTPWIIAVTISPCLHNSKVLSFVGDSCGEQKKWENFPYQSYLIRS